MPQPRYAAGVRTVQLIARRPRPASVNQKINTPHPPPYIFESLRIICRFVKLGNNQSGIRALQRDPVKGQLGPRAAMWDSPRFGRVFGLASQGKRI
jgi:hypothetical protein